MLRHANMSDLLCDQVHVKGTLVLKHTYHIKRLHGCVFNCPQSKSELSVCLPRISGLQPTPAGTAGCSPIQANTTIMPTLAYASISPDYSGFESCQCYPGYKANDTGKANPGAYGQFL